MRRRRTPVTGLARINLKALSKEHAAVLDEILGSPGQVHQRGASDWKVQAVNDGKARSSPLITASPSDEGTT